MEYIGLDVHRHYTVYTRVDEAGQVIGRVPNGELAAALSARGEQ